MNDDLTPHGSSTDFDIDIDAELARFEAEERQRMGLGEKPAAVASQPAFEARPQYREQRFHDPKTATKSKTTLLVSGLWALRFPQLRKIDTLDVPDHHK